MSRGVNRAIILGNLGKDPEIKFTQSGAAIANFSIATDESYKDKNTGQMVSNVQWHRIVAFNRLAEIVRDYLKKGSKVYLEGRLQTRKWQDQGGQDRYTTEIVANEMQMLDAKPEGHAQAGYQQQAYPGHGTDNSAQNQAQNQLSGQAQLLQQNQESQAFQEPSQDFDQEIPF